MTKKNPITLLLFMFLYGWSFAQVHEGTKRLFWPDNASPLLNVYDIAKGTLIKSINRDELVYGKSCFNADQSKYYSIGKMYAHVIDPVSLEAKKLQLLTDTAVFDFAKMTKLNEAERDRVLAEIQNGNLEAKITETSEMKKMKLLPTTIFSLGVTEKGYGIVVRIFTGKTEYTVFDLNNNGNKVASYNLVKSGTLHGENILHPEPDGSISVIDLLTGNTLKKIENAYNEAAISEARVKAKDNTDKYVSVTLNSYGTAYFTTTLNLGMTADKKSFEMAFAIFDAAAGKVIYEERGTSINKFVMPLQGSSPHTLLQKVVAKTPEPVLQMPPSPDFSKMKPEAMGVALQEWQKSMGSAQADWKVKHGEWSNPQNFVTKVFADVALSQELFSVEGARYAGISGEHLYFQKEGSIELYDIKTRKLIQTIYLI